MGCPAQGGTGSNPVHPTEIEMAQNGAIFFMPYYVYILQSEVTLKYYCGQTDNIEFRLLRHNNNEVKSTKHATPWKMVGYIICDTRSEAMRLEREIKKRGIERWFREHPDKIKRG